MTNRRIVVEAAFGFGPFDTITAGDWVSLLRDEGRERVRAASWSFGRDNELDAFPAGTATVVLSNRDRALDPDNAASPYVGQLLPLVPVRIRSQDVDTLAYTDEFYGYVENGWEQVLAPQGAGDCRLQLVDLLGVIGGYPLPGVFEHTVLSYDPAGFWVLDRADAERVADLSGRENAGTVVGGVEMGDRVLVPGRPPAARFTNEPPTGGGAAAPAHISLGRSPILQNTANAMVLATFEIRDQEHGGDVLLFEQSNGNAGYTGLVLRLVSFNAGGEWQTSLQWQQATRGSRSIAWHDSNVDDRRPHLAIGWPGNMMIDGDIDVQSSADTTALGYENGATIGRTVAPAWYFDGWIGVVAVWDDHTTVGASGRAAIVDAYNNLNGLRSDQQIAWALDRVGVPAGMRDLDAGSVLMGPADTVGRDALEWIRDVVATEQGDLYVDHRNGGVIRFTSRYARHLDTRSTVVQATFSDAPGAVGVIRYPAEGLDIASNGRDGIVNQVTVGWADGDLVVRDDVSAAAYGSRSRQIGTVATTAAQARSVGEWLIARYSEPRSRVRGVTASQRPMSARDDRVQGLQIGDRVEFRVHPLHTGAPTTVWLWVDGIDNDASGVEWVTSFRFAPVDTFIPWIWGTSEWGVDNRWG